MRIRRKKLIRLQSCLGSWGGLQHHGEKTLNLTRLIAKKILKDVLVFSSVFFDSTNDRDSVTKLNIYFSYTWTDCHGLADVEIGNMFSPIADKWYWMTHALTSKIETHDKLRKTLVLKKMILCQLHSKKCSTMCIHVEVKFSASSDQEITTPSSRKIINKSKDMDY